VLRRDRPAMSPFPTFRVRRASVVALAVPLALAGCGGAGFSSGSGEPDASTIDGGPDSDIIVAPDTGTAREAGPGEASIEHDARADAPSDAPSDALSDAPSDGGEPDSTTMQDAAVDAPTEAPGCATGDLDCNGVCTPSSLTNCGSCGHDCANLPNVSGTVTCSASGVCTFTEADCAPGWAHCTSNPDDGCETNVTVSPNCGTCGKVCSAEAGVPVCNGTDCVSGCSGTTPTLCNGTTCVNTTTSPQNCGGCNDACTGNPANSTATCTNSTCGFECVQNYTGCPTSAPTACDDLTNDPNNCGACATQCHAPIAGTVSCTASSCVQACATGLSLCMGTGQGTYGTCVNETNDPNNCGSCGDICGQAPNKITPPDGTSICASSICDFTCSSGYTKCEAQWLCMAPPATGSAFVSAGSGFTPSSAGGCGTASQPCEKLSDGVAYAKAQGYTNLYLAHGTTYGATDGPIVLDPASSLTVYGGWTYSAGAWTPDCAPVASSTVIVAPAGGSEAVSVTGGTVTLQMLSIQNNTTAGNGQSLYGVFVTGSQPVALTNVDIQVAAGGAGQSGSVGTSSQPVTPCTAVSGANAGAAGSPAGATPPTTSAQYTGGGYMPANGGPGGTGGAGQNGSPAPTPPFVNDILGCQVVISSCQVNSTDSYGGMGTNGCGTTGAAGGTGGDGGGASIGIYVWGTAAVTLAGGTITTGGGGKGGSGGAAGAQLAPVAPKAGAPGPMVCEAASSCGTKPSCALTCQTHGSAAGGAAGGPGGEGAAGAQGGGGSGGDSYCYVTGGGAPAVSASPTAICAEGPAGSGGLPNGPAGVMHVAGMFGPTQ
jgi:hypothetical protein